MPINYIASHSQVHHHAVNMVTYRCGVCKSTKNVYPIPRQKNIGDQWKDFIKNYNPTATFLANTGVCRQHFDKSCFKNFIGWETKMKAGLVTR